MSSARSEGGGKGYNPSVLRALLLMLVVSLVAATAALAAPAKLTVVSHANAQFAVRGASFHPGEGVVVVVLYNGERASKRLAAGAGGGFVVRFPSIHVASCGTYIVRATGNAGSHSALRVIPECPQPLAP
jgi:hypothetical protein